MIVESLNIWAAAWRDFMLTALVDGTVLFVVVVLVWWGLRHRASAQLGYLLFLLVIARLALPLTVPVPAWLGWLSPREAVSRLWQRIDKQPEVERVSRVDASSAKVMTAADLEAHRYLLSRTPQPQTSAKELPRLSTAVWLMLAWAAVVAGLPVQLARVQWTTARRFRNAIPVTRNSFGIDVEWLGRRLGSRRSVPLVISEAVGSPVVWGLWRPRLILPPGFADRLPREQLEWALLHELAHVKRGDLWVSLLQRLVQIAYFFHPAVWLANWQVDRQREFACDDAALAAASASGRDCAAALVFDCRVRLRRLALSGVGAVPFQIQNPIAETCHATARSTSRGVTAVIASIGRDAGSCSHCGAAASASPR